MILKHAILHILDKDSGNLMLSQKELPLSDPFLNDYISKLCAKIERSEAKKGVLATEHPIVEALSSSEYDFVAHTHELANKIFQLIAPAEEIAAADYLFFEATDGHGATIFGILRLDYHTKLTHFVDMQDQLVSNSIIQHHAILPMSTQLPSEAWLVNRDTWAYQLVEKQYIIEGKRQYYFSEQFLEIEPTITTRQQIKDIKKTVTHVAKKHNEEDYIAIAATQQSIAQQLEESDEIDAALIFDMVFKDNPVAKDAAYSAITEERVAPTVKVANVPSYEKRYSKQKFKLANGIEITIPLDIYENKDIVEFINHPNGTVSVMIKNIENITNQFNG